MSSSPSGPSPASRGVTPGLPTNSGSFKATEKPDPGITLGDPVPEPAQAVSIPSHANDPVSLHLTMTRRRPYGSASQGFDRDLVGTDPDGEGTWIADVTDIDHRNRPAGWTTCRKGRHYAAHNPDTVSDLDCPCDVGCPKCDAPPGMTCSTPTGYAASWHKPRIEASPRIIAMRTGARTRCDLGDHDWVIDETTYATATCSRCERTEPIDPRAEYRRR